MVARAGLAAALAALAALVVSAVHAEEAQVAEKDLSLLAQSTGVQLLVEENDHGEAELVEEEETAVAKAGLRASVLSKLRDSRRRRRRRTPPPLTPEESARCQSILDKGSLATSFSVCLKEQSVKGQYNTDCAQYTSYDTCREQNGCWWWHLKPKRTGGPECLANPCFRINNGQCTLQATGGRCVWYTAEQNLALRGNANPGCYKSPCANPERNNYWGCKRAGNQFYKCVWCPPAGGFNWGCQNLEDSSTAQCWNIGGTGALPGCTGCTKQGAFCTSSNCVQNCCQSPMCLCQPDDSRTGNVGVNIFNRNG